jgi:hypothetical protein
MSKTAAEAYAHAEKAHDKMAAHEDLCAERYGNIKTSLTGLHDTVRGARNAVLTVGLALICWLATQVYDRLAHPPAPPAASQSASFSR